MNIHDLVSELIVNTKGTASGGFLSITRDSSLGAFLPELVICLTIVLLLTVRLFDSLKNLDVFWVALAGSAVGFVLAITGGKPFENQNYRWFTRWFTERAGHFIYIARVIVSPACS